MSHLNDNIKEAIDTFDIDHARQLLREALPDANAETYFLASKVAIDDVQRREFLEKAVELDSFHEKAYNALKLLKDGPPAAASSPPRGAELPSTPRVQPVTASPPSPTATPDPTPVAPPSSSDHPTDALNSAYAFVTQSASNRTTLQNALLVALAWALIVFLFENIFTADRIISSRSSYLASSRYGSYFHIGYVPTILMGMSIGIATHYLIGDILKNSRWWYAARYGAIFGVALLLVSMRVLSADQQQQYDVTLHIWIALGLMLLANNGAPLSWFLATLVVGGYGYLDWQTDGLFPMSYTFRIIVFPLALLGFVGTYLSLNRRKTLG